MSLLRMENISKSFPGVTALDNVNIDVKAGEVHALVGENGAGKSTLIKILYGVYKPDGGHIYINDREVHIQNAAQAIDMGIGVVFQELNLCQHLDIANNIFLGRMKHTRGIIDDKWAIDETRRLLTDLVKLDVEPTRLVKSLSLADRQMVEIVKVLSQGCKIVIFDEPTSSLTTNEIQHLFRIINDLKRNGVGIIYISHRLEELDHIADRITVLRDGKNVETLNYQDTNKDGIIRRMVGREMQNIYPDHVRTVGDVIFEANNVTYQKKLNVQHIEVRAGEIVGIAGLVGSGRTEAMRAIFGADPADTKQVILDGKEHHFKSVKDAIDAGFIYLTEDRKHDGVALVLDVESNISMASLDKLSKHHIMKDKAAQENAKKFCERLDIKTPGIDQLVRNLSGGTQQKVIVAKWLTRTARVMVFDEPTRGIDVGAKYEIYNILNQLSDEGIGIVMISSDLPEILGMSDRILVFRNGSIVAEFNREDADSESIMKYATGTASPQNCQ